jgi:phosphoenolpyruvate carboxykinase (ATP)
MVWHPTKYAELLAERLRKHRAQSWLVNTGWTGGPHGVGSRMKLGFTRAIIDAIHSGALDGAPVSEDPLFGLAVPTQVPGVPSEILLPRNTWKSPSEYDQAARKLAFLFQENFKKYEAGADAEVRGAGPRI